MNVTDWVAPPTSGTISGLVNANVPATLALPPLNVAFDNVWPYLMAKALGTTFIVGVAFMTLSITDAFLAMYLVVSEGVNSALNV